MKLLPRDWVMGPVISAFIVYLVTAQSMKQETAWELVFWFVSCTIIYYLGSAVRNAIFGPKGG